MLLIDACEINRDKDLHDAWLTLYPLMMIKKLKFQSFEDYKNAIIKPKAKVIEKIDIFIEMVSLAQHSKVVK